LCPPSSPDSDPRADDPIRIDARLRTQLSGLAQTEPSAAESGLLELLSVLVDAVRGLEDRIEALEEEIDFQSPDPGPT
jgi:hypothetical protein